MDSENENESDKQGHTSQPDRTNQLVGVSRMLLDATGQINKITYTAYHSWTHPLWRYPGAAPIFKIIDKSTQLLKEKAPTTLAQINQLMDKINETVEKANQKKARKKRDANGDTPSDELPQETLEESTKEPKEESPKMADIRLSALNGVVGDYLAKTENPLAIPMQLIVKEQNASHPEPSTNPLKLLLFIHGSSMSEHQWQSAKSPYIEALEQLGYQILFLRYNSGLHISDNGQQFSALMDQFIEKVQQNHIGRDIQLTFICHSMGGLVARSACHYAQLAAQHDAKHDTQQQPNSTSRATHWVWHLKQLIMLGTPHHGALLERFGNIADALLHLNRYTAPFATLAKIRSCGITDLRYGNVTEQNWQHHDRFILSRDRRSPTPLPAHVRCYAVAATINKKPNRISEKIIGDGLVSINSALGIHQKPYHHLNIPHSRQWIAYGLNHNDLLGHKAIEAKLVEWLA